MSRGKGPVKDSFEEETGKKTRLVADEKQEKNWPSGSG